MTTTRDTLKNYFKDGERPNGQHFAELVEAMLHMDEEGFSKSARDGFKVSAAPGYDALVSFYRDRDPGNAQWVAGFDGQLNGLSFAPGPGIATGTVRRAITFRADAAASSEAGRAASAAELARATADTPAEVTGVLLDVDGSVLMRGRRGALADFQSSTDNKDKALKKQPPLANGNWHAITGDLHGCQGFEVMAGVGLPGKGRYALLHAVALNAYNPRRGWLDRLRAPRGIRVTDAWFGKRCDRLELQWHTPDEKQSRRHDPQAAYQLRIRSSCNYGEDVEAVPEIRVYLTRLWFDESMAGCASTA